MQWVRDRTGRFPERPYYQPAELDAECERLITEFLSARHRTVAFPVVTDDLSVLVEQAGAALDMYADLSVYGGDIDGFTDFVPGRDPLVRISRRLSENPRYENRLRTTLTHEFGHVRFHSLLWEARWALGDLFAGGRQVAHLCRREMIAGAPAIDWAEWQAGYVSGALLMPASYLHGVVRGFLEREQLFQGPFPVNSRAGQLLVGEVTAAFAVSKDAARVRLLRHGVLTEGDVVQGSLFA
jgi:IrrE N-terminal-like domain